MKTLEKIEELISEIKSDTTKVFDKKNKAAATRARKNLQELRSACKDLRGDIIIAVK